MESARCQISLGSSSDKWGWQHWRISVLVVLLEYRWKPKVWSSLVVSGDCLARGIVLRVRPFSRMKTQDFGSGNDGTCALFPSWRHCFWRPFMYFGCCIRWWYVCCCWEEPTAVARSFFFSFLLIFSFGCVHPGCLCDILLVQRLGVIGIFAILIDSPSKKTVVGGCTPVVAHLHWWAITTARQW